MTIVMTDHIKVANITVVNNIGKYFLIIMPLFDVRYLDIIAMWLKKGQNVASEKLMNR